MLIFPIFILQSCAYFYVDIGIALLLHLRFLEAHSTNPIIIKIIVIIAILPTGYTKYLLYLLYFLHFPLILYLSHLDYY